MPVKVTPVETPNDGLPENWKPIDDLVGTPAEEIPRAAPAISYDGPSPYFAASLPLTSQLIPDIMPTRFGGGTGAYRIMPPGASGVANNNAATQTIVEQQVTPAPTDTDFYQTVQQAGAARPQESNLNVLAPMTATDNPGNNSTDLKVPDMVGDSGSGGTDGLVPAPPSGAAAAGKFLKADATWAVPPGTGVTAPVPSENEIVSFSGTSGTLAHTPSAVSGYTQVKLYRNGVRQVPGVGNDFTWSGTAVTLTLAAGGSDVFIADYYQ